jgi:hypothetical protein
MHQSGYISKQTNLFSAQTKGEFWLKISSQCITFLYLQVVGNSGQIYNHGPQYILPFEQSLVHLTDYFHFI